MNLQGKTALITGGSTGIGLATALALAEEGCTVYCFNRTEPEVRHPNITPVFVDITKYEQVKHGLTQVHGTIDILFNNAGVMRRGTIDSCTQEDFDLLFDVHVKGAWLVFHLARTKLAEDAVILQMSSRHALYPPADPGLYGLSKQAAAHFAELIARTYPSYKVKILYPGPIDTALSRYGVEGEALEEKVKHMHSTEFMAGKVLELIKNDHKRLIFRQEERDYIME